MTTAVAPSLAASRTRSATRRILDGLTWKGLALVALLCAVNALRRMSMYRPGLDLPVATWLQHFATMFGLSLVAAIPVVLTVVAACNLAPSSAPARYAGVATAAVVSSIAGTALMTAIEHVAFAPVAFLVRPDRGAVDATLEFLRGHWLRYGLLAAFGTAIYVFGRSAAAARELARHADLDRARLDQNMEEARLQMLQAQIEPHFLFNTLAMLRRLHHTSPDVAREMLDSLMRYLQIALPQVRAGTTTLGAELSLVDAYLAIHRRRMGDRLACTTDVPVALEAARLPPLMLLTLVENAVKHGLAPLPEGGAIRVAAFSRDGVLVVQVSDSGRGFAAPSGAGTGLANIRARLAALYGRAAHLDVRPNQPKGVVATLSLPLRNAAT